MGADRLPFYVVRWVVTDVVGADVVGADVLAIDDGNGLYLTQAYYSGAGSWSVNGRWFYWTDQSPRLKFGDRLHTGRH